MVKRQRYATRRELVRILAEHDLDTDVVHTVVERLEELGVPVDALVKITVDEPIERG